MSTSDGDRATLATEAPSLSEAASVLRAAVEGALGSVEDLTPDLAAEAVDILTSAALLYGGLARTHGAEALPVDFELSTTDAATTASALVLSQHLSLFEFNIWHARMAQIADAQRRGEGS